MQGVTARCRVRRFVPLALLLATTASGQSVFQSRDQLPLTLWYRTPASAWNEALPVGSGRLGVAVLLGTTVAAATPFLISHLSRVVCTATDCL